MLSKNLGMNSWCYYGITCPYYKTTHRWQQNYIMGPHLVMYTNCADSYIAHSAYSFYRGHVVKLFFVTTNQDWDMFMKAVILILLAGIAWSRAGSLNIGEYTACHVKIHWKGVRSNSENKILKFSKFFMNISKLSQFLRKWCQSVHFLHLILIPPT